MRYVALTAATLSSAFIMAQSGPAPVSGANPINSIINKSATTAVQSVPKTTHAPVAKVVSQPQPVMVTVAEGDTMSSLAEAHGTTYQRLFDANTSVQDPNIIHPGDQLRVPDAAETLADRPLPVPAAAVTPAASEQPAPVASQTQQEAATPTPPAPQQVASTAPAAADGSVWDRIAACESGGNWAINTGNGFYGGLQFTLASWQAVGGSGLPSDASRDEQIMRAQILESRGGWGNWPVCSVRAGM